MSTDFYTGTNWEQSSGPLTVRAFQSNELWPAVADGKVALAAGDHPVLAVGDKSFRGDCLTGVVVTYDAVALIAQVNIADGFVVRQYVANVSGYTGTSPNAWNATIDIGDAVFVDDSPVLAAGTTLSFAKTGSVGVNPLAGYVYRCQDEFVDSYISGPNTTDTYPISVAAATTVYTELCILLVNDSGI
jgi:hypothetical protein